jgi:galactokinase
VTLARDPRALREALVELDPVAAANPAAIRIVRAPGRVNLIGEHTDYNAGFVLPVAIDLGISIALVPTVDRRIGLTLASSGEHVDLELDALGPPRGTWVDYVAGTAWALQEAGATPTGFRGLLASDLPIGAGLSSSAALELAAAWALGGGQPPLADPVAVARAAQRAETDYVGVACGPMDQCASSLGLAGAALLLDCRSLEYRPVLLPMDEVSLVVCDSGVSRRLAASAYAERRAECGRAVAGLARLDPSVISLRDASPELLERAQPTLDPVAHRRARHVISENFRVLEAAQALQARDLEAAGRLFSASHASLRDDFEVSTPELDRLVEVAVSTEGVLGARLTGAGFGGATVNLVRTGAVERLAEAIARAYRTPSGDPAAVRAVIPSAGCGLLDGDLEASSPAGAMHAE